MTLATSTVKHAMAFVDGQNLFQHAKDAFGHYHPNYDPKKLHAAICEVHGWTPNLVRFYTGVPVTRESPMWAAYWNSRILSMKRDGISVTTRPLRYRKQEVIDDSGNVKIVSVAHEKGIDTRLVLDIVSTARKKQWDVAVIFSQDQDLAEVVEEVREIGKEQGRNLEICCPFPHGPDATSRRGIERTNWFRMDREFYDACLDPKDYRPQSLK